MNNNLVDLVAEFYLHQNNQNRQRLELGIQLVNLFLLLPPTFLLHCWQWETNGQCVKGDNCSFRHDTNKRGKVTPSNPSPNSFMQQNERKSSRTRSPRGRSPSGRTSRWPCKDYLKGTCNNSFCEKWHPQECLFYKTKSGCRFGEKCSYAHRQVDEQPTRGLKRMVTKVQWRC